LRELEEETGLRVYIKPGFEDSFSYFFKVEKDLIHKTVWFFSGEVIGDSSVILSYEHQEFLWLPYDKALKHLTYQNASDLLLKVHDFVS
jgi:8-oxo-dGTP pyrophosphatase MutT (NUDIX family)